MEKKIKKKELKDFDLIDKTAGKICNGVYIKKDKTEIIIQFAWGDDLHYRILKEYEESL